jgi:osmotically inducible protein OsmC
MADIQRTAEVTWEGTLREGSGTFTVGTGSLGAQPVSWPARTEEPGGRTSPEELIAAAHASCYAMSLAATLGRAGHTPEQLRVGAAVTFAPKEGGGFRIARSALTARGRVPGIDADQFAQLARDGEAGCPVSNALRENVEITVDAALEG